MDRSRSNQATSDSQREDSDLTYELDLAIDAARKVGDVVRQIAQGDFESALKANQDPVTTADLAADSILKETLIGNLPESGWLSEETRDDPERLRRSRVWIVDPIDGTREFIKGIPEYAVSIALVEDGIPVVSVVHNPATGELFSAMRGRGTSLDGEPVSANHVLGDRPVLLASRSEIRRGEFERFEKDATVLPMGSIAYKLALVAAGRADATFSLGPKNEWDIAAGVLLVEESGGNVTDQSGDKFTFNRRETLVNGIVAMTKASSSRVWEMIREG